MSELTFNSPGVSTREIDLSQPSKQQPEGVPAGIIGTAVRGPAFVPITVATFQDFITKFGNTQGELFGPLAMNEWLRKALAGTYVRILGVGDGKKRVSAGTNKGRVNNAGFVVGQELVQGNGVVGKNVYAKNQDDQTATVASEIAIDLANAASGDHMTFNVPAASGGSGTTVNIRFTTADDDGSNNAAAATISIGYFAKQDNGAIHADSMTDIRDQLIAAINDGTDGANLNINNGNPGAPAATMFAGITAVAVDGQTSQIRINADTGGPGGNNIAFANTVGDVALVANLSGGGVVSAKPLGRTYFLGHFASESNGSTFFQDAGYEIGTLAVARPIIRGVLFAASGVVPTLGTIALNAGKSVWSGDANAPSGSCFGDVTDPTAEGVAEFEIILNGHKSTAEYPNIITSSFNPKKGSNYFGKELNRDPSLIEKHGYYLYSSYDVYDTQLEITASGVTTHIDSHANAKHSAARGEAQVKLQTAFILSGSSDRNVGTATSSTHIGQPNYENFQDRFRTAHSPFVISQQYGGKFKNLFKVHALDDGRAGSDTFKITIENLRVSSNENDPYPRFDLVVRNFADSDADPSSALEKFTSLDLNPSSENYLPRRIGDTHSFYNFDQLSAGQKLTIDGTYPNVSNFIRVELSPELVDGSVEKDAVPTGFRGLDHLVTSGTLSSGIPFITGQANSDILNTGQAHINAPPKSDKYSRLNQIPVPFRDNLALGSQQNLKTVNSKLTWGVQFEKKDSVTEPNRNTSVGNETIRSFVRYFPNFHTEFQNPSVGGNEGTPDKNGTVLDADRFNNNLFSLERVEVITDSGGFPDSEKWQFAKYQRKGTLAESLPNADGVLESSRFIEPCKDFAHNPSRKYLAFTFPLQGGFDGVNIFDKAKTEFRDSAVRREMDDVAGQGGTAGPTVSAYRRALDVMESKTDVDIQLLAIPGLRHPAVTDAAIDSVERRFDALYIMDVEEKNELNETITGSLEVISVRNTVTRFASRNLDSSFAAAYFPDVVIQDPDPTASSTAVVRCPPSVPVLGALSNNDSIAHPWFAPAGFNRGTLDSALYSQLNLNRDNLDDLYEVDINPITSMPHTQGVIVFGQKTLLAAQSALDRINVRRLLIEVRRQVRAVANSLLFEPNRESTLAAFSNSVNPILQRIQQQQGLERFKVQIDTSTTTQADVENNTIRGKIFLQPTRSVEFISLDFVCTNAGAEV